MKKTECNVLMAVANSAWFGKRAWHEPTTAVPILTSILKNKVNLNLLDANADNLSSEEVLDKISELKPDIILIPMLAVEYWRSYHEMAKLARIAAPCSIIISGGVYPTVMYDEVIKDDNIDYVFIGYAETRLDNFVEMVVDDDKEGIKNFSGIAYKESNEYIINPIDTYIGDVEEMVKPDYSLVDLDKYFSFQGNRSANFNVSSNNRNASIITSYGCPNNCIFCATRTISGRKTAFRKPEDVLEEIDYLVNKYNIDELTFLDDCILTDRKRAEEIFNGIIERGYNLNLRVVTLAAWHLDEEILALMKKAGFTRIGIAIESGCDRVLHKIVRKPLKLEIIPPLVKLFKKYDIMMTADFIIGFPGETWEEIRQTFRFAEECDIDLCMFHIATVLPKTDLYKMVKEQNLLPKDFSFFNDKSFGFGRGLITTDEFTPEELAVLRAYEWDRINFSTPEKIKRACALMEITEEELNEHRKATRRNLGIYF